LLLRFAANDATPNGSASTLRTLKTLKSLVPAKSADPPCCKRVCNLEAFSFGVAGRYFKNLVCLEKIKFSGVPFTSFYIKPLAFKVSARVVLADFKKELPTI
jgi:hypothetical protein